MQYIVYDLEATCWEKGTRLERMEPIEIGAVRVEAARLEVLDEFCCFVQPVAEPELSEFCRQLTSIRQEDVDGAPMFPDAFRAFLDWIGPGPATLCSWGSYDRRQLQNDCRRHGLEPPALLDSYLNLKLSFSERQNGRRYGVKRALRLLGIPFEGTHHRGIDDARNIAKILIELLQSNGQPREVEVKRKREKGYWEKRSERFEDGANAKSRAAELRQHSHTAHVKVDKVGEGYIVVYSVAKWYLDELQQADLEL